MQELHSRPRPHPDELWLSQPPYLMIARILAVHGGPPGQDLVSYVLYDEDGATLEHVERAALDAGFWRSFQPLTRRQG